MKEGVRVLEWICFEFFDFHELSQILSRPEVSWMEKRRLKLGRQGREGEIIFFLTCFHSLFVFLHIQDISP